MIRYLGRGDSEYVPFPGIEDVGEYDTIAWGGDLSVRRLWDAYSHGIFPWYPYRSKAIVWTCPRERYVIFPKEVHVSHSMRTLFNSGRYRVTFNECFEAVIMNCATVENRHAHKYAWLGGPLLEAMLDFHRQGYAKSVEVWDGDELVGGLYGVRVNRCFCGDSMFSLKPSASKVALIGLARKMEAEGGLMIDCQYKTEHLESMGGRHITYEEYMSLMNA